MVKYTPPVSIIFYLSIYLSIYISIFFKFLRTCTGRIVDRMNIVSGS